MSQDLRETLKIPSLYGVKIPRQFIFIQKNLLNLREFMAWSQRHNTYIKGMEAEIGADYFKRRAYIHAKFRSQVFWVSSLSRRPMYL